MSYIIEDFPPIYLIFSTFLKFFGKKVQEENEELVMKAHF